MSPGDRTVLRPLRPPILLLVCAGAVLMTGPALAQWPYGSAVTETVHNLSRTAQVDPMRNYIAQYGEACVYCHTPHASRTERPLWNRRLPSGPYLMYPQRTMLRDVQPTGTTRLCLSCHDGTVALDDVLNPPSQHTGPNPPGETLERCARSCHNGGDPKGGFNWENVWFENDLSVQHPVSVRYDPARNAGFLPISAVEAAGLRLEDGKVQCNTCHDPHTQVNRKFLRIPNVSRSLCLVCHVTAPAQPTAHFW